MVQKIDCVTPLAVYNDLRKIARGDFRNRDSRLAAVDARMTRLESELVEYARQSQWAEDELREWNHGVARKFEEEKPILALGCSLSFSMRSGGCHVPVSSNALRASPAVIPRGALTIMAEIKVRQRFKKASGPSSV